jgi:hypothetical protein
MGYQIVRNDGLRIIFENPHAMPRAFAVHDVRTLDGLVSDVGANVSSAAATTDQNLLADVRRLGVPVDPPAPATTTYLAEALRVTEYHHDRIRIKCNLKEPALVVLTDCWNPRWSAAVDGKPAYIGKVNVAFRGVAVTAGQHEVEFRYYPWSRLFGQVISVATLTGLIAGLWFWKKRTPAEAGVPVPTPTPPPLPKGLVAPSQQTAPAKRPRSPRKAR